MPTITKREPLIDPSFIHTELISYTHNDKQLQWERVKAHNTVHVLVYHVDHNCLLLVKQYRPPVDAFTIECCAGIIDNFHDKPPHLQALSIAAQEVYEELGYRTELEDFTALPPYIGSAGLTGSTCYPFYVEVHSDQDCGQQLTDTESIEIVYLDINNIDLVLANPLTDASTRYLLQWYQLNKGQ